MSAATVRSMFCTAWKKRQSGEPLKKAGTLVAKVYRDATMKEHAEGVAG
ncbi:hypothetical protein BLA15816_04305 [Burkholderia lata]|nr:hypothetical protein BLA15816_04305 [Burkholderia lata]